MEGAQGKHINKSSQLRGFRVLDDDLSRHIGSEGGGKAMHEAVK